MITFKTGNIVSAEAEALVNTVNTVGVMGKGIALQFKKHFPENYKAYRKAVEDGKVHTGQVFVVKLNNTKTTGVRYIFNFPTKAHWRHPSKMQWIREGLADLRAKVLEYNISSIAIPPLGAGQGGLKWDEVKKEIEKELSDLNIEVLLFEPSKKIREIVKEEPNRDRKPNLTQTRAQLLHLLYQYRALDEYACEFAAEKLSYFLQRFGDEQLRLNFQKGYYGPYSGNVRHVLGHLNGYFLRGYEQKDRGPFEPLELNIKAKPEVDQFLEEKLPAKEKERLARVEQFIQGFETPLGLELLSSVDYIIREQGKIDFETIKEKLSGWTARKKALFKDHHLKIVIDHLKQHKELLYPDMELEY